MFYTPYMKQPLQSGTHKDSFDTVFVKKREKSLNQREYFTSKAQIVFFLVFESPNFHYYNPANNRSTTFFCFILMAFHMCVKMGTQYDIKEYKQVYCKFEINLPKFQFKYNAFTRTTVCLQFSYASSFKKIFKIPISLSTNKNEKSPKIFLVSLKVLFSKKIVIFFHTKNLILHTSFEVLCSLGQVTEIRKPLDLFMTSFKDDPQF